MAVFEGNTRSLTPSFQNIQEALNQRANIEAKAPQTADIFTPIVQRLDLEFTKQRDFEKKLSSEGKSLFTPDMAKEMAESTGIPVEAYNRAVGRYYSADEFQKIHDQALEHAAETQINATGGKSAGLTPEEVQQLNLTGKEGRTALAGQSFQKDHTGKQVVVADKTSSTGYRYALNGPTGLTATQFEAPAPSGVKTGNPTEGEKAVDRKFAQVYSDYVLGGGSADVKKQVEQLEKTRDELSKSSTATGPVIGSLPDGVRDIINPRSAAMQQRVEEVVQRNLRAVLGAQFTEGEGTRLIARAYNPKQPETENVKRLDSLISQIKEAAQAKEDASAYFEEHGTIKGFKGKLYQSANDFLVEKKSPAKPAPATTPSPSSGADVTDVDAATFLKSNGKLVTTETIRKAKEFLRAKK